MKFSIFRDEGFADGASHKAPSIFVKDCAVDPKEDDYADHVVFPLWYPIALMLLHPPLPLAGVSIVMERERQQKAKNSTHHLTCFRTSWRPDFGCPGGYAHRPLAELTFTFGVVVTMRNGQVRESWTALRQKWP